MTGYVSKSAPGVLADLLSRTTARSHDHGSIAASEGRAIYFHRNSLIHGDFEALEVGGGVRIAIHPGEGETGPQASTIAPVGKHHPAER